MNAHLELAWNGVASQLRGYVRSRVRDHHAAEDILQDVYVKAHQHFLSTAAGSNIQAWLFRIAKNKVIDYVRTHKTSDELDDALAGEEPELHSEEAETLKESFRKMMQNLPSPYREAVTMTDIEGLTQKELAQRLGISLSGAKSRVQRGRALLKKDLLECCDFEFDRRGKPIDYTPKGNCCHESAGSHQ